MKIDEFGYPMMSQQEVGIINDLLESRKPIYCLEWGSGTSTIYFPKMHAKNIRSWLSIEHNGNYVKYVAERANDNVDLVWVPNNEWYIDCVKHQKKKYDFILIDGLFRDKCLDTVLQIAKPGAVVLLHDAGREEYQEMINSWGGQVKILCEGEKKLNNGYYAHRGLAQFSV